MNAPPMNSELDTPNERRWLWLAVLGGHVLLLGLLIMQKPRVQPKPLEIELSLSAESQAQEPAQPPVIRPAATVQKKTYVPMPQAIPSAAPEAPATQTQQAAKPSPAPISTPPSTQAIPAVASATAVVSPSAITPSIVLPNTDAAYLTNPKPGYPPLSRRLGEQGVVTLNVLVNTSGDAQKVELAKSSGYPRLDEAAIRAVQGWRFSPGKRASTPEAMWVRVPISFILEK